VSEKIRNLINSDLAVHGARYGWTVRVHPTGGKLIVNVPTAEDSAAYQYVMNTETGSIEAQDSAIMKRSVETLF
jgi:hypothetical protein